MLGLAQKLFFERTGKWPWKKALLKPEAPWPFLDKLVQLNHLSWIDLQLAKRVVCERFHLEPSEAVAAFVCHLSQASRLGHLCIKVENEQLFPAPEEISETSLEDREPSWTSQLHGLALQGAAILSNTLSDAPENGLICKNGQRYYFKRQWLLETDFIKHLQVFLTSSSPEIQPDPIKIQYEIDQALHQGLLLSEQAHAIWQASQHTHTLITGGPGTGKTYTAGFLLRILLASIDQSRRCRVLLAAPTGKAAANLEASILRRVSGLEEKLELSAKTLHALLHRPSTFTARAPHTIPADILLIDECSMIDVAMMGRVMEALSPSTRVIMLGDPDQLPAVEAGSLFADMISAFKNLEGKVPAVVQLKQCMRAESNEIIQFAQAVREGQSQTIWQHFHAQGSDKSVRFHPQNFTESKQMQKKVLAEVLPRFSGMHAPPDHPLELLAAFSKYRLLTPLRQGLLGAEELNRLCYAYFASKAHPEDRFFAPITIAKNDYQLELFNGEMGVLETSLRQGALYGLFPGRQGAEVRRIPAPLLPPFEFAYALSIHKSQGSEFDSVLLLLPAGCEQFGREALYTAITRARSSLDIWSDEETIQRMIQKRAVRQSGIKDRLKDYRG